MLNGLISNYYQPIQYFQQQNSIPLFNNQSLFPIGLFGQNSLLNQNLNNSQTLFTDIYSSQQNLLLENLLKSFLSFISSIKNTSSESTLVKQNTKTSQTASKIIEESSNKSSNEILTNKIDKPDGTYRTDNADGSYIVEKIDNRGDKKTTYYDKDGRETKSKMVYTSYGATATVEDFFKKDGNTEVDESFIYDSEGILINQSWAYKDRNGEYRSHEGIMYNKNGSIKYYNIGHDTYEGMRVDESGNRKGVGYNILGDLSDPNRIENKLKDKNFTDKFTSVTDTLTCQYGDKSGFYAHGLFDPKYGDDSVSKTYTGDNGETIQRILKENKETNVSTLFQTITYADGTKKSQIFQINGLFRKDGSYTAELLKWDEKSGVWK